MVTLTSLLGKFHILGFSFLGCTLIICHWNLIFHFREVIFVKTGNVSSLCTEFYCLTEKGKTWRNLSPVHCSSRYVFLVCFSCLDPKSLFTFVIKLVVRKNVL